MDKMTDDKFKSIWGDDLFNYAYAKSNDLVGYPDYHVMMAAAIGKIAQNVNLHFDVAAGALGG